MREHVFTITISSTYMIRCGFFAIPLCCFMFSLISLWRTQSLVITTAQQIEQLKNELLAQEKALYAPIDSAPAIISKPSPFVKYITESLYGTRPRIKHNYFNTTINTPLEINTTTLLAQFGLSGTVTNIIIFDCYNGHFNTSHTMKTLTYKPNRWYKGFDTFKYQLEVLLEDGTSKTVEGSAKIRVSIGVVLNKALLTPPTVYTFSETDQSQSATIKEYLDNLNTHPVVPTHDTWLNRRYNRCAVVGNGGSLRGSKRGKEIDSHDIVVRLNLSPLKGYDADVGSRMNISVAGGPASASCWLRSEAINSTYEVLSQASFRQHWGKMLTCPKEHTDINYLPMNYLFVDLVDKILEEYHIMMFNGTDKKYRSTGMMAVTAMVMICDHVSVYGFERGPKMENNYYEGPTTKEWTGHSYQAEKAYYKDLAKGTGLFEPFLELYDLYTSFSYIVD